ncbi:unnamed protein product, partial [marine sediment metagenome]
MNKPGETVYYSRYLTKNGEVHSYKRIYKHRTGKRGA